MSEATSPTVVLVHGAFADASSWNGVIERVQAQGVAVRAPANPLRGITGPYQLQEDGHASYWGQLAMRNCLRLAYNGGSVQGGRCVRVANGLNGRGEPQMELVP